MQQNGTEPFQVLICQTELLAPVVLEGAVAAVNSVKRCFQEFPLYPEESTESRRIHRLNRRRVGPSSR